MQQRKPAFFSLPALLAMTALVLVALYLLFPRHAIYEDPRYLESPDSISLAYLDTLLKSDPDNQTLRLTLGRMQQKVGENDRALATLAPLLDNASVPLQVMTTYTELLRGKFFNAETDAARQQVRNSLTSTLEQALAQIYSVGEKEALVASTLPLLSTEEQLAIRQQLFELTTGKTRLRIGQQQAIQQEGMGDLEGAKYTLESIQGLAPPNEAAAFTRNLIRLDLATGMPESALGRFQDAHKGRELTALELREGMRLADLAGKPEVSAPWLKMLAQAEPANMEVQRRLLLQQTGQGNIREALITAEGMENNGRDLSRTDRERIARLYEWNNQPEKALVYWRGLFLDQPPGDTPSLAYDRATSLAAGLFKGPALIELYKVRAARGQLSAEGYNNLANALISNGEWNDADRYLNEGMSRFPRNALLRQRKLSLLINSRRFFEAIQLLETAPTLSDEEKVQLANLHWRLRDPEAALAVLDFTPSDPALAQEVETMRLDLARMLNRTDLVEQHYDRLTALPSDSLTVETRERLIGYSWQFGSPEETLLLTRQQYEETGEVRHLVVMAELQSSLGLYTELSESLVEWNRLSPQATNDPAFWRLSARAHQQNSNPQAAQKAFQEAARISPNDTRLLSSWGWFLVSQPDLLPAQLPVILSLLADSPSPDTYALQVYGHFALGEQEQADAWLAAARTELSDDPDQLLALSDYAKNYGAKTQAEAEGLRRLAVGLANKQEKLHPDTKARLYSVLRDPVQEPFEPLYRFDNRALQAGFKIRDLGGFSLNVAEVTGQLSHDRYRWLFSAEQATTNDQGLLKDRPRPGSSGRLQWQTNYYDYLVTAEVGTYTLANGEQLRGLLELTTQPWDKVTAGAALAMNERVTDSAEAWWLTSANRLSLSAGLTPWSRLEVNGEIDYLSINEAFGGQIGTGYDANLRATYSLFRNDPAWRVSLNYQSRQLSLGDSMSPQTLARLTVPLSPGGLLSEDYRRIGFSSEWSHGEPHALYRTTASPRYFLALDGGYVLSTSNFDYGARMGLGWRIAGDDELAISAGYSSDSPGGQARADAKITYTLYLGH
ncbi:tetratricopeptide repeat protein [Marinobacter sp. KMM 10035]|uniref:tetratricopeptide repeat protein n=1 Tax=Marinobacter sp. KMM 10035 TaxID=3134034 RepID=UPI00397E28D5